MRMLNVEYERVASKTVPGSQAGCSFGRACPEQVITVRIAQELAALQSLKLCIGYQDMSACCMSIIKEMQLAVEEYHGVDVAVILVMRALHPTRLKNARETTTSNIPKPPPATYLRGVPLPCGVAVRNGTS